MKISSIVFDIHGNFKNIVIMKVLIKLFFFTQFSSYTLNLILNQTNMVAVSVVKKEMEWVE